MRSAIAAAAAAASLFLLGAFAATGCGSPGVVRFRVIYSSDVRGYVEPCT